jgi:hypothetical protein
MVLRRLVCAIGLLMWSANLGAQVPTATVSGRVASADGLSLPGVTITVTSANLLGERILVTSENGDYIVPLLPPGDYTITFESPDFCRSRNRLRSPARSLFRSTSPCRLPASTKASR